MVDTLGVVKALSVLVAVLVLVSACSAESGLGAEVSVADTTATPTTIRVTSTATAPVEETSTSSAGEAEPEVGFGVIEFVDVLADLADGSIYEDLVIEDPEVFVATGFLFCERLTDGGTPSDLLTEYVANLHDGELDDAPGEVLDMSGWILGTAVGYLCPEHSEILEEFGS